MKIIEETLNKDTCMKIARKTLCINRKQQYSSKDEQDQIINNRDEMMKVVKELYRKL